MMIMVMIRGCAREGVLAPLPVAPCPQPTPRPACTAHLTWPSNAPLRGVPLACVNACVRAYMRAHAGSGRHGRFVHNLDGTSPSDSAAAPMPMAPE